MRGDRLTFQHRLEAGCRGEAITHRDGRIEKRVLNEDSLLLMDEGTLLRPSYYDHDRQHRASTYQYVGRTHPFVVTYWVLG